MASIKHLFADLGSEAVDGVAYKNLHLKKQILSYFGNIGNATIVELGKALNYSNPKIAEIISELISNDLVKDYGKVTSGVGRRPNIYGLEASSMYFIGVDVKRFHINIGLLDFQKNLIKTKEKIPFQLINTTQSLDDLCAIIRDFTKGLSGIIDKIAGIGLNLSGRINYKTGYSYSFFHFSEEPLSQIIENKVGIKTYLENDSRAMAYGEFCNGVVSDEKNVLYINADYGIGMGIMIGGQLYYGKSGFAGEFGHIHAFNNEKLCHCGKKGCLETEASGQALVTLFKEKVKTGTSSIVSKKCKNPDDIHLEDIIEAANHDDVLAIECIEKVGEKLGSGIATVINLFNPELVILGGRLAETGAYLRLPVKSAIYKYSLSLVNNDTSLKMAVLGEQAGVIGACLLVRNRLLSVEGLG